MPHLKPHRITVNIPEELMPLLHEVMREEHYHSESACLFGCFLEYLLKRTPHEFAPQILRDPPEVLDKVVIEIILEAAARKKQERAGHASGSGGMSS